MHQTPNTLHKILISVIAPSHKINPASRDLHFSNLYADLYGSGMFLYNYSLSYNLTGFVTLIPYGWFLFWCEYPSLSNPNEKRPTALDIISVCD